LVAAKQLERFGFDVVVLEGRVNIYCIFMITYDLIDKFLDT